MRPTPFDAEALARQQIADRTRFSASRRTVHDSEKANAGTGEGAPGPARARAPYGRPHRTLPRLVTCLLSR